ncbi:MAG: response regulator [Polyangiaceae bacterium]
MTDEPAVPIRILFVDDESRVLDGIRHSLRARRKVWHVIFAADGPSALKELERARFDVVISDMRMPGMDGAELLSRVRDLQAHAVRIVLSAHVDEATASRAAQVAHRFLSKPCQPGLLEATILRTLELRQLLTSDAVRTCVSGMGKLPSPPKTCLALQRALEQDAALATVAQIIEADVAMATKVLQLVNSSLFGVPRKMVNVAQAVGFLGLNTVRNLVLADSMFQSLGGSDAAFLEREQARSLLSARIARALLPDKKQAELACTAALLHDVGILAMQTRMGKEHREVREQARSAHQLLCDCERSRFGTSHAEVGAYLLGLWGLPFDVIDAVAAHHNDFAQFSELDVNSAVAVAVCQASWLLLPPNEAQLCATAIPPSCWRSSE